MFWCAVNIFSISDEKPDMVKISSWWTTLWTNLEESLDVTTSDNTPEECLDKVCYGPVQNNLAATWNGWIWFIFPNLGEAFWDLARSDRKLIFLGLFFGCLLGAWTIPMESNVQLDVIFPQDLELDCELYFGNKFRRRRLFSEI